MRDWTSVAAGAIGGALLGVVIVFAAAHQGWLPGTSGSATNIRGYLLSHPELLAEMTDRLGRAISLVGDTYTVQVYRETALRFRLGDAQAAVREKIVTVWRVAEMLGSHVQSRRDLTLEVLVVVLILVEVLVGLR